MCTGKSLSEALILASTTDCSLNYKFNTWKFQAQTWAEHYVYRNCFLHSEHFLYSTCSPYVLQKEELPTKIYLYRKARHVNWTLKITKAIYLSSFLLNHHSLMIPAPRLFFCNINQYHGGFDSTTLYQKL